MLRSFLIITARILWRNKVTSFVNIFSLSIGITAFILIMLYVHHETRYDKFNEHYDRIYRLEGDNYAKLPPAIGTHVKARLPEVESIARLAGGWKNAEGWEPISYSPEDDPGNVKYAEANFFWADSTTFDVFTFPFIQGDPHSALREPFTIVLTESTARKLFGDSIGMAKSVKIMDHEFMVTGIIRDVNHSHIEIDALISMESLGKVYPHRDLNNTAVNAWLWSATYLLLADGADKDLVEKKINGVLVEINDRRLFDIEFAQFRIRPLREIYFEGSLQNLQYGLQGNMNLVRVLSAIGVFMLILACINYINLTTARSIIRTREVAIKRVAGSSLRLLRGQFILESVVVSVIALVLSMTIIQLALPAFNTMAMVDIRTSELNHPFVWIGLASGVVIVGIVAGLYPALYLTAARPVALMKGEPLSASRGLLRKLLMTFQFTISVVMIIGLIVNFRQVHFLRNTDLGFKKEQVVVVITPGNFPGEFTSRETFRERLKQHAVITNVAFSSRSPGAEIPTVPVEYEGVTIALEGFCIDEAYLDVMEIELHEGRAFSLDRPGEKFTVEEWTSKKIERTAVLLNETAVEELGIDSPLGKILYWKDGDGPVYPFEVIGIVKDFHFRSFHHKVSPLILLWISPLHFVNIKISSSNIPSTLKLIEKEWKNVYGQKLFQYEFLDQTFHRQYKNDENLATVIGYFTGLAVIVACLGLFALSSFMVTRRTKEIGIRKSMGASTEAIYSMLSWDFIKWVLLAVIIATPIAWYLIHLWLRGFAYHIKIAPDIFVIATLLVLGIALLTVTWQSLRAANANPVKALRYE
ncbi:MAG: ABC transporter permease [Cyclobacteriaceae bacterium]